MPTATQTFQVTHPFHPLFGKTFELLAKRQNWGADQVYYHDGAGRLRTVPIAWTSLIPQDTVLVIGQGRSPFRLADLLELARCLEQLRQPDPELPQQEKPFSLRHGGVK